MTSFKLFSFRYAAVAVIAASGFAHTASADFVTPSADGWTRAGAYTTFQTWETFSSASPSGTNAPTDIVGVNPELNPANPNGAANVVENTGGAFLTGGGNIYSFSVATQLDVTVPEFALGGDYVTTVLFQARTQGTEADYGTVRLSYTDGSGPHTISPAGSQELFRQSLGGFGGALVDYAFLFEVPYSPSNFKIEFDAVESSMSFDRAAVDTIVTRASESSPLLVGQNTAIGFVQQSVPEPASLGLLAGGATLLVARRRRA